MNIIFYHSSLKQGGAERVITSLANYFSKQGHLVSIMTIDNSAPEYQINKNVALVKLSGLRDSKTLWQSVKLNIGLMLQVRKCVKLIKPDVVVCFGVNQLFHAYWAVKGMECKIIGSERANPYKDPCGRLWNTIKLYLYHHVDGFVFQTNGARQFYNTKGIDKGCVIQNPVPEELMQMENVDFRQRPADVFYSFGRLSYAKSYDFLIKSFSEFHKKHKECKLVIYGEGKDRGKLEKLILELQAGEYIFLPGKAEDVFCKLQTARFFILSSRHEGMPNSLLEAMALGCICVSTDCSFGPNEIIADGKNGLLVKNQSQEKMVEALERVYTDKELQKTVSENALDIRNRNSVIYIGEQYLRYFRRVCKKEL